MKQIAVALTLCAIPATTFAQNGSCPDCDHVAPYFRGSGGFIGTVAEGVDEVTFVASCGSATTTGEATIQGDTASQLFTYNGNGLACDREGGTLEIAGLEDGGWYWIHDARNTAVGNLVSVDILDNRTTELTDAGDSISMSEGRGAVFLKHPASGRVGILPNILPVPYVEPAPVNYCDYTGTSAANFARETTNCMLGNGSSFIRALGAADAFTGGRDRILDGASVTRPAATDATVEITYDLWGEGGHYVSNASATGTGVLLGHARGIASGADPLTATFTATAATAGPTAITNIADAGLAIANAASVGTLTVSPNTGYCGGPTNNNHSVTVTVNADATSVNEVTPPVRENVAGNTAATHEITVVCP